MFKEFQKDTFFSVLMHPFHTFDYKAKNKMEKVYTRIILESLKKSNDVLKFVNQTIPFVNKAIHFADVFEKNENAVKDSKLEFGLFLREAGFKWDAVFLIAIAKDYY